MAIVKREKPFVPLVAGVSDVYLMPRKGFIRLGESMEERKARGLNYPQEIPHLGRIEGPHKDVERYRKLYGEKPTEIVIYLYSDNIAETFPQEFVKYEGGMIVCEGNGEKGIKRHAELKEEIQKKINEASEKEMEKLMSRLSPEDFEYKEEQIECKGAYCTEYLNNKCRIEATLKFRIKGIPGVHPWWIRTSSKFSMKAITNVFEEVKDLASRHGASIRGVPFVLRRELKQFTLPKIGKDKGLIVKKYVITIDVANIDVDQLIKYGHPEEIEQRAQEAIKLIEGERTQQSEEIVKDEVKEEKKEEDVETRTKPKQEVKNEVQKQDKNPETHEGKKEKPERRLPDHLIDFENFIKAVRIEREKIIMYAEALTGRRVEVMTKDELRMIKNRIQASLRKSREEFLKYLDRLPDQIEAPRQLF